MGCRIDKWLWAARFFKTRTLAQQAIVAGRVRLALADNQSAETVKAARDVQVGHMLHIQQGDFLWIVRVLALSEKRGPASVAHSLYEETEASQLAREEKRLRQKAAREPAQGWHGRPEKRERRQLSKFLAGE